MVTMDASPSRGREIVPRHVVDAHALAEFGELGLLRAVLEHAADGISVCDRTGRLVLVNRAADRILGMGQTDAAPEAWSEHYGVFLPDGSTRFPRDEYPLMRGLRGEDCDDVLMLVRNPHLAGDVTISAMGRPLRGPLGDIVGAVVTFRDVTAHLRAERALAHRTEELAAANERLERERRSREDLSAFIVHDLKNPLAGIVLNARYLAREPALKVDERNALMHVLSAAQSMNSMVLNLLDIGRSEDGALVAHRTEVDVHRLLEDVAVSTRAHVGEANIAIVVRTSGLVSPVLQADADLLRRVFENLADNALRYSPRGSTISLEAEAADGDAVDLRVCDQGGGVPAEHRERIFEKYVQLGPTTGPGGAQLRTGRGLGLMFCRLAVQCHGGRIWVEEGVGEARGSVCDCHGTAECFEVRPWSPKNGDWESQRPRQSSSPSARMTASWTATRSVRIPAFSRVG